MDSISPNFSAFKEPKAFIKLLQIILAILAFALTTNFSSFSSFQVKCNNTTQDYKVNYTYPFNINESNAGLKICGETNKETIVYGSYSSPSQFYVFVGVITMLYCFAALVLYICFSDASIQNERIPKIDFMVTLSIAILWFIGSVAWADGVSKMKMYTNLDTILYYIDRCKPKETFCTKLKEGSYGNLNASLIAGFANVALWAANLWFVFKDTLWYERRNPNDQIIGNESLDGGNM